MCFSQDKWNHSGLIAFHIVPGYANRFHFETERDKTFETKTDHYSIVFPIQDTVVQSLKSVSIHHIWRYSQTLRKL
jgi:hypothetical protein